jgi:crooked neck
VLSRLFFFSEHVFVFPDDEKESNPTSFKFLQIAHAWKEAQRKKEAETLAPKPSVARAPEDVDMDENGKHDTASKADEDQSSGDES